MNQFGTILNVLSQKNIEFIVVGGVAAAVHGSVRLTIDIDVVYHRTVENISRLVEALAPHSDRISAFGISFLCLQLEKLIEVKRAAGRPKDLESIAELESILDEQNPIH